MEQKEFQTVQVSKDAAVFINDFRGHDHDYFFREKDNIADSFSALELVSDDDFPQKEKDIVRLTLSNYNSLINALVQSPND